MQLLSSGWAVAAALESPRNKYQQGCAEQALDLMLAARNSVNISVGFRQKQR